MMYSSYLEMYIKRELRPHARIRNNQRVHEIINFDNVAMFATMKNYSTFMEYISLSLH